jgi:hypothetical protein
MRTIVNMVIISTACAKLFEPGFASERAVKAAPANFPSGQINHALIALVELYEARSNNSDDGGSSLGWLLSEVRNSGAGHEK